jgi:ribonuclease HII
MTHEKAGPVEGSAFPDAPDEPRRGRAERRRPAPDLSRETSLWLAGMPRVAGIDEAGRGPLAGPVVAAAVVVAPGADLLAEVRDSKLLTLSERESMFDGIFAKTLAVGVGAASVEEIERLNVLGASYLAMRRALRRVSPVDHSLVDGPRYRQAELGPHTAVVDGDALSYSIACASIVAKVVRDRLMRKLARRFPGYGWERNVGYGTPEHLAALRRLGPTPYHRRSFRPVRALIGLE